MEMWLYADQSTMNVTHITRILYPSLQFIITIMLLCYCPLFQNPVGQINMRDARVEEVDHVSDSDSEDREGDGHNTELTIGIFPTHQGPTYLLMPSKQEKVLTFLRKDCNLMHYLAALL